MVWPAQPSTPRLDQSHHSAFPSHGLQISGPENPNRERPNVSTRMVWIADTVERLMSDIGVFHIDLRNLIKTLLLVFVLPDKKTLVDCAVSIDFKLIVRVIKCQEQFNVIVLPY